MPSFRQLLAERVLLADGAMGTLLCERGAREGGNKSLLSLQMPDTVAQIHRDYIRAGADIISSNTFDANPAKLRADAGRLDEVLRGALELAQRARREEGRPDVLVAGSIGPLGMLLQPYGPYTFAEMAETFQHIARRHIEGGADLLVFETFSSLLEIKAAIAAVRKFSDIPVVASMTFNSDGISGLGDEFDKAMVEIGSTGADLCGLNCFLGPKDSYDLAEPFLRKSALPFGVMPNAGLPAVVNNRTFYLSHPEYFHEYALNFVRLGVNLIGSCCGTTPAHTARMREAVSIASRSGVAVARPVAGHSPRPAPLSPFRRKLGREFVITLEVTPPKGLAYDATLARVRALLPAGVDAVNVTENPLAKIRMSPSAFSKIVLEETGADPILHFTLRDRNLLAIQSDLLGAYALGISTLFAVRGDPAVMGDFPAATTVYDIDTVGLIRVIKNLNRGLDISGKPLKTSTDFLVGAAANSASPDPQAELARISEKVQAGADFLITQPVFDVELFRRFREQLRPLGVPVIAGVMEIRDSRYAQFLHNEVPGFTLPAALLARFAASADPAEGARVAIETGRQLRDCADGVYLVSSLNKTESLNAIIEGIRHG